jgi:hypothetical protein
MRGYPGLKPWAVLLGHFMAIAPNAERRFPQVRPGRELRNFFGMFDDRIEPSTMSPRIPSLIDDYWRAADYLAAGQTRPVPRRR